jgi:sulfocyanin
MATLFSRRMALAVAGTAALGLAAPLAPVRAAPPHWLTVHAKAHTATLTLIAGYDDALGGFNFNGYGKGKMIVSVPAGYRVHVVFSNRGKYPHSAVVVAYAHKGDVAGYTPAFRGAASPDAADGVMSGTVQRFSFVANKVGTYALVCGVAGHEGVGMWDVLKVTKGGKASLTVKQ